MKDDGGDESTDGATQDPGTLPEGAAAPSARERARSWRKAMYQKAKAAHKERTQELKKSPATVARKEAQAAYRRAAYQTAKERRKGQKDAAKKQGAPDHGDQAELESGTSQHGGGKITPDLRLLLTTADQLPAAKPKGLRLVRDSDR